MGDYKVSTYCRNLMLLELMFLEETGTYPDYIVRANEYGSDRSERLLMRLAYDEYEHLLYQSECLELKPSTLARQIILEGAKADMDGFRYPWESEPDKSTYRDTQSA
jgi:hypothetical protein